MSANTQQPQIETVPTNLNVPGGADTGQKQQPPSPQQIPQQHIPVASDSTPSSPDSHQSQNPPKSAAPSPSPSQQETTPSVAANPPVQQSQKPTEPSQDSKQQVPASKDDTDTDTDTDTDSDADAPPVQPKPPEPKIISVAPPQSTLPAEDQIVAAGDSGATPEVQKLIQQLQEAQLPDDLREKARQQIERINLTLKYGGSLSQLDITSKYINWITGLPWYLKTEDNLDINAVKESLDASHFGLESLKKKILEYLSIIALQKRQGIDSYHVQSPFFVGLAGTGKTTFAKAIAVALGRKFVRIPFGGLSSARDLRGQSKTSPESEPGYVIKAIQDAGVRNPVILLDELDRVSPDARAEIMGVLLELLDPGQNLHFTDYFLDYPFNLNEVLFVATGNNTTNVAAAVLDRLDVIQMPNYNDEEKIAIGKRYILPKLKKDAGIGEEQLQVDEDLWPLMVRPLGFEPGIRSLERMVNNIVRRVAYQIVSGKGERFTITKDNVQDYTNIIVGG